MVAVPADNMLGYSQAEELKVSPTGAVLAIGSALQVNLAVPPNATVMLAGLGPSNCLMPAPSLTFVTVLSV
jgi:hypothetical protein